jgi:azurin
MNNQLFAVASMLLVLVMSPLSLAFASTSSNSEGENNDDFLNIREATIDANSDEMSAFLKTHGHIPTNGDGGAFGYGVLTTEGLNAVVVSTTHAGVQDSEEQTDANDPVWHNHFVTLGENSENCGKDLQVESITFESPGQVNIENSNADLTKIPSSFSGTDALSKDDLTIEPGTTVEDVVSFTLSPQFNDDDELEAVCVTDLKSADNIAFDNNNGGNSNGNRNSNSNDDDTTTQGIGQSQSTTQ